MTRHPMLLAQSLCGGILGTEEKSLLSRIAMLDFL